MAELDRERIQAAARMVADVAIACDQGDPEKMVAFAIGEFAQVLGSNIYNIDELAAIICVSIDELARLAAEKAGA